MRRILAVIAGLLCLSAVSFAQAPVPSDVALTAAIADVNAKRGTAFTYNGGQLSYTFNEERVTGDNLGCASVAATNQNAYIVMTTQFDFNFDGVFEWEHRFAYETDGSLKMVVCREPDLSQPQPTQAPTATETVAPETPQATPEGTPVNAEPIFGRDGPRIFPALVCGELPTRLVNGSVGRVIPGGAQNNLRQQPDLTALKIGELAAGETFTVMDGPFCNGDIAWYLVGDGTTPDGWTAEGVGGDYFLEPLVTDAQLIRPENVDQLAPVGGVFGPATAISANTPGSLLVSAEDSLEIWGPMGGFAPLATIQWDVVREVPGTYAWAFADNTGRVWTADIEDGTLTLAQDNAPESTPITVETTATSPLLAVDGESNFAAIATADGVELHQIGRGGALNELLMTLPASGEVLDVAFTSDGMALFVLTANELTIYRYILGEGWTGQTHETIAHDLTAGKLAVAEGGSRLAISGTSADGAAAVRVLDLLNDEITGNETSVNYDAADSVTLSAPSFNADGSLVAVYASDGTVRLIDTASGEATLLTVGEPTPDGGTLGLVEFSRDGLLLWVLNSSGVQAYAVAAPSAE
jgi:hypothetical protein